MSEKPFDLVEILKVLSKKRSLLISATLGAIIVTAIIHFVRTKEYQSKAEIIVSNPVYTDRHNVFNTSHSLQVDYFAGENSVDKIVALLKSDEVIDAVVKQQELFTFYKMKGDNLRDVSIIREMFRDNCEINRTENYTISIAYTSNNAQKSSDITNAIINTADRHLVNIFSNFRKGLSQSLINKNQQIDSMIAFYTDSLGKLRNQYGIYEIISPNRYNLVSGAIGTPGPERGYGIELVQNIESIKDQLVQDRAKNASIINEFETGGNNDYATVLQKVTTATPSGKPHGMKWYLKLFAAAVVAFGLTSLYVLLQHYLINDYKKA